MVLNQQLVDWGATHCVEEEIRHVRDKLGELNRRPARGHLEDLVDQAGLQEPPSSFTKYLRIRNSLVHTGDYADDLEMSPDTQHWTVLHLVDRVVLGLLGYRGTYIPCTHRGPSVEFPKAYPAPGA